MSAGRCAGEQAAGRSETRRGSPAPPYLSCRPAFIVEAGHSLSCWNRLSALTQRGRPRALLLNDRGAPSRLPFRLSPKPERSAGEGAETVGGPSLPEPVRFLPPEASRAPSKLDVGSAGQKLRVSLTSDPTGFSVAPANPSPQSGGKRAGATRSQAGGPGRRSGRTARKAGGRGGAQAPPHRRPPRRPPAPPCPSRRGEASLTAASEPAARTQSASLDSCLSGTANANPRFGSVKQNCVRPAGHKKKMSGAVDPM